MNLAMWILIVALLLVCGGLILSVMMDDSDDSWM